MITRIYIDNCRCFTNFELRPNRVNLLLGNNGTGKSTFLEMLHSIVGLAVSGDPIDEAFSTNTLTRWDTRNVQRMELDVNGNGGKYRYTIELSHDVARQVVTLLRETVMFDSRVLFLYEDGMLELHKNEGTFGTKFPFRGTRSFLPQLEARPENTLLTWFLDYLRQVWLIKLNPIEISGESEIESDSLDPDGSNFASWYRHFSQERPDALQPLTERLAKVLPGFRTLRAVSVARAGMKRELVAAFSQGEAKKSYEIFFDELSDGERATIILYCVLMDADLLPKTLLLDEPENYVGLELIQPWLVELKDRMGDDGQLFIVSHHPEVIDYLAAEESILFERLGGGPTRVRSNPFDKDLGLRASEIVERGLLDAK